MPLNLICVSPEILSQEPRAFATSPWLPLTRYVRRWRVSFPDGARQSRPNWAEVNKAQGKVPQGPRGAWTSGQARGPTGLHLVRFPTAGSGYLNPRAEGGGLSPGAPIICRISPLTSDPVLDRPLSLRMRRASALTLGQALVLTCLGVSPRPVLLPSLPPLSVIPALSFVTVFLHHPLIVGIPVQ